MRYYITPTPKPGERGYDEKLHQMCVCGHPRKCHDVFQGSTGACYHTKDSLAPGRTQSDCNCTSFRPKEG